MKRDKEPALREEMEKRRQEAAARHEPWDAYRVKQEELKIQRQLEEEARLKGKTYMDQLSSVYNTDLGKGDATLDKVIDDNMSGRDQEAARKLVAQGGWLTTAQEIEFSTKGLGTKEEMLTKALEGKTAEEIKKVREEWATMHPGESLEDRINSETSGRLNFELLEKLKGEPMTPDEEMAHMERLVQHEREHGSTVFASDERERLEFRYNEMKSRHDLLNDPSLSPEQRADKVDEFNRFAGYTNVAVSEHKESVQSVTDSLVTAVTTAIAVVLAAAAIFFSGGTATPAVIAALGTWWGAATAALVTAGIGIGIRQAMLGSDYGIEDMGIDMAIGGIDAVTAAATAGLSKIATTSVAERLAEKEVAGIVSKTARARAFEETVAKLVAKDPTLGKRPLLGALMQNESRMTRMFGHGVSGMMFGAAGAIPSGAARSILDSKTWEGGGAWEKILSGTTGAMKSGAVGGLAFGVVGGIRNPHAPTRVPAEHEVAPPGGHTPETLGEGLPVELRRKVPITVDSELEGSTVRVHYEVDESGVFKDIHIRAGPEATPRDIELHVQTVRTMQKYAGLQGRARALIAKVRGKVFKGSVAPSRRFLEAQMEVEKLPAIIDEHVARLSDEHLDVKTRADMQLELEYLKDQLQENQSILEGTRPEDEARGYVAANKTRSKKVPEPVEEEVVDTPPPEQGRAEKISELHGKAVDAESELASVKKLYESLSETNNEIEAQAEQAIKEGRKPLLRDQERYKVIEAKLQKLLVRASKLQRIARSARQQLKRLSGSLKEAIKWEDHGYDDLGTSTQPCFKAGTMVHTPAGLRAIEALRAGEEVCVWDFDANRSERRPILRVVRSFARHVQQVRVGGESIPATRLHRFWNLSDGSWAQARRLFCGDRLLRRDGQAIRVDSVAAVADACETFNLEISGIHNYFVGETGVLVHNGDADDELTAAARESKFVSGERVPTKIYLVLKKNANGQFEPFYVGKTFQGEKGSVLERFEQHLAGKEDWKSSFERGELKIEPIKEGTWTEFETAVWEEHYIRYYGGLKKENGSLVNARHELTRETYEEYKDGHGHNACVGH